MFVGTLANTSSGRGIYYYYSMTKTNTICYYLRCSPPEKSNEYQKIYSNWCHEFEKYKTAMKTWERKQDVSY